MKSNTILTLFITSLLLTIGIFILTNISSAFFGQVDGNPILEDYDIEKTLRDIVGIMVWVTIILFVIFVIIKILEIRKSKERAKIPKEKPRYSNSNNKPYQTSDNSK